MHEVHPRAPEGSAAGQRCGKAHNVTRTSGKKQGTPLAEEIGPRADTIHSGAGDGGGKGFLASIEAAEGAAMPGQPS